ncbi:hypothetical protein BX666DRAFT_1940925 [Dichotomocladium elegans]|nr:hypothetical protein BX666DRAFT_1940925 [Dichotomocladium elegans]
MTSAVRIFFFFYTSMQFVVFMELIGTLPLPTAVIFTAYPVSMAVLGRIVVHLSHKRSSV